jgi:Holliday junction resolvase YEN1
LAEAASVANPELRTLFHRIIRLVKLGALVLIVFDGPHRPKVKRGNRVVGRDHAFGCEWRKVGNFGIQV